MLKKGSESNRGKSGRSIKKASIKERVLVFMAVSAMLFSAAPAQAVDNIYAGQTLTYNDRYAHTVWWGPFYYHVPDIDVWVNNWGTVNSYNTNDVEEFVGHSQFGDRANIFNHAGGQWYNYGTMSLIYHPYSSSLDKLFGIEYRTGELYNWGNFTNYGTLNNQNGAQLTNYSGGTLANFGTFNNDAECVVRNEGTLFNDLDRTFNLAGGLINTGSATLNNYGILNMGNEIPGAGRSEAYLDNYGTLKIGSRGVLNNLNGSRIVNNEFASLNNYGTLNNKGWTDKDYYSVEYKYYSTLDNYGTLNNFGNLNNNQYGIINNVDGGTLNNLGTLNNAGLLINCDSTLENNGVLLNANGGKLHNWGMLINNDSLQSFGSELDNTGTLSNVGMLSNGGSSTLTNFSSGLVSNKGTLHNYSGATIANSGSVQNSGTLVNSGTISGNGNYTQTAGTTANLGSFSQDMVSIKDGTFNQMGGNLSAFINNSGTLIFSGGSITGDIQNSGRLTGAGTINGNVAVSGGLVSPGNSPGTLVINGGYSMDSSSTLMMELGGTGQGTTYDLLRVNGTATLAGMLDISIVNGFVPTSGNYFDILVASAISDTFNNVHLPSLTSGLKWDLAYLDLDLDNNFDTLRLSTSPVPIPSIFYLFALGFAGLIRMKKSCPKK